MAGVKLLRKIQLGSESSGSKGTAVTATVRWRGNGVLQDNREVTFPDEDVGHLSGVDRTYISRVEGAITFEDTPATFEQLPYILEAGVMRISDGSSDSSGSGWSRTYSFAETAQANPHTFTIEGGDDQQAEEMEYSFVESFTLSGAAGESWMMNANWVGRQVQDSSFTSSGSITLPSVDEILFSKTKLYIDEDSGTIGSTQISNTLLDATLNATSGFQPVYTADGELYFSFVKQVGPEVTLDVTFEHDSNATGQKTAWRNETPKLIRLESEGPTLSSSGAVYDKKLLQIDLAGKYETFDGLGEQDGNDVLNATFRARYNSTAAEFAKIVVVNEDSALT